MKQQEVFKKIGTIIKELNEQYAYLVANENELNDLELELFVANAHFLAEHSEVLRKLNLQNTPAVKPVPKEKYFEPLVQKAPPTESEETSAPLSHEVQVKPASTKLVNTNVDDENPVPHIDLRGDDTGMDYSYIREEPETIRHELTLDDIPNWEDDDDEALNEEPGLPKEEIIKIAPAIVAKKEPAQPIKERQKVESKVDDTREEPLTVNQKISAQLNAGKRITEHVNTQPVTDLKQAITLNDKLLYIKDLFNGYSLAYSEAIEILNRFNTFDEADKFLKSSYIVKNNWASKQATADKFYALLERRYA